ncbi:MAG: phosphotransferase family protein, partial [Hyphococcus sp.]
MSSDPAADFTGAAETPEHLRFDEDGLVAFMEQHVDGFSGPIDVKKFKGGQSNPTYLIATPTKTYV